jgi:hypothetical protein
MVISRAQMNALSVSSIACFDDRVFRHLTKFFPYRIAEIGVDGARRLVVSGRERAARHSFSSERDVCRFIDLAFILGLSFDTEYAWAAEILGRDAYWTPSQRMDELIARAEEHLVELLRSR